MAAREID